MLTNTERQQIVEEVNAGTYGIDEALDDIAEAQKGEEVRKALYAEALVLNREGHAGSTDMIARQQIANLQTSVTGQIGTLRTEVGEDISEIQNELATKTAQQDASIANVVANYNVEYGSTELWASTGETGALAAGTTVTLSEDVSHFDYIDIYSFLGNNNILDTLPVDAKLQSNDGYALRWVNLSDPGSGTYEAYVRIVETKIKIIGTTLTIIHQVTYSNGASVSISGAEITQSNRSTYMGELGIMKVVGRKITANTEVTDMRIGADGTTYNSAGAAVRAQVTALESAIPAVDSTLSTQGAAADAKVVGDDVAQLKADLDDVESTIDPLMDSNSALTADYQCIGYYYNSGAKQIKSSANLETFKYNIPDDCVAVRIQSNFYASQIMLSNTDTTSATFPSMSINLDEIVLRPATAPSSATNVDITYVINDDNRYKYLYVPHYVGNTNPVVVTGTMRGEISSLTYEKIDAAGRYRRIVPTGNDIFTSDGFTSGYILSNGTGGTTENPNYGYTDYIDIEGNSFTLDGISGNGFSVVYDENKNPLGSGAISLFFDKNDRPDGTKYIRFNVHLANLPSVKMNVYETVWITYITPSQVVGGYTDITVGTGKQFASVVEAVEYANSIASDYNTVNVYIYPGTYDIIGEYNLSEQVSSWNGLTLADYVNLIGVGSPDKVVLNGELPADISSYAFDRNNVSTLNFWKNNNIKNLTITAKNMRYCLHNEDGKVYAVENAVETIENCVFIYYENDTGIISSRVPIGIGAAAGRKTTFRNCVFDNQSANGNYPLLLHNNTNAEKYCEWIFESCNFIGGTMNSLKLSSAGSGLTEIVNIIGCRLPHNLRFDRQNVYTGTVCEYKVFGHGNAISGTASWDGVTESASVTEMLIN